MHRCYVPNAEPPVVQVTGDPAHHMTNVLRLAAGAAVVVFDGQGREWSGRIVSATKTRVSIDLVSSRQSVSEPAVHVTVAIAVLKGDQMNEVVRDVTALGAAAIAPFVSAHAAVSGRANWDAARERWQRVAVASAMQCGRSVVPDVREVVTVDALFASADGVRIMCVEPAAGEPGGAAVPSTPPPDRATLLIGPEGGWAIEELDRARAAGMAFLSLGPRTLRAQLAPVVALATLWERWR